MKMSNCVFFYPILLAGFGLTILVHAQDQSGFISIDCGILPGSSYNDETTDLKYISDSTFIETGINKNISSQFQIETLAKQFYNVRSFPEGMRNCYTLNPAAGKGSKYLIRASFMYGNYDDANNPPEFDLYLGVNLWDSVKLDNASAIEMKEIIHIPMSNDILVCLVNTGLGTPFISALELRLLRNSSYPTESRSLALYKRYDIGSISNQTVRYKDDAYDRIWTPKDFSKCNRLSTSLPIRAGADDSFLPPSAVMSTAVTPTNGSEPLKFLWEPKDPTAKYYVYMYFAEVENLQDNQIREFNISENDQILYEFFVPSYLFAGSIYRIYPFSGAIIEFSLDRTKKSTIGPIINALEVYMGKDFLQSETNHEDVDAIKNIKTKYGVKRNWQGDPCAPKAYSWDGLNCSYDGFDPPRIISLNLSSSGLTGEIAPYLSNLTLIQYLDLSNNSLTGKVPEFLSLLPLKVLNLKGNKLTGQLPVELMERSKNGSLQLSVGENPNLCSSVSCQKEKKNKFVIPLVASAVSLFLPLIALVIWWNLKRRKGASVDNANIDSLEFENRHFTYSEVLNITDNFNRILGKGGFGTVYHGYLEDGTEVAVKMLSSSSGQGFKEFQAEVKLLMRVHHRNLTYLVGYCNEDNNMGLIYEFMANGNLQQRLSDERAMTLSWEERLRIAMDAAQGLEYLHRGCNPPIVHRDIKSANILLNENLEAKLADFGLSKIFPISGSHVSTVVAGTPGYLDPEYYVTNWLSEKSDVYSFGVVLLEIITSRPVILRNENENIHISQTVIDMISKGDIQNNVDPNLGEEFDIDSAWKAVELALECASHTSSKRPKMSEVVTDLKECLSMELSRKIRNRANEPHSKATTSVNLDTESTPKQAST